MATSNHAIVSHWFAERMATGDLARDPNAHAQAIVAKEDLVKRLDAAKDAPAAAVAAWFGDKIAIGAVARNTVAYNQAFAAKDDLLARLAAGAPANVVRQSPPKPAKSRPVAPAKAVTAPVTPAKAGATPEPQA